jgi:hypothetical protein
MGEGLPGTMGTPESLTERGVIRVNYKYVEGWHVFTSEEVFGLYVANKDPERAYNGVATSIQLLLELNEGIKCEVSPEFTFQGFNHMLNMQGERQWLPIESAPTDGTEVLGWRAGWERPEWCSVAPGERWNTHIDDGSYAYPDGTPTHWYPTPPLPK